MRLNSYKLGDVVILVNAEVSDFLGYPSKCGTPNTKYSGLLNMQGVVVEPCTHNHGSEFSTVTFVNGTTVEVYNWRLEIIEEVDQS